MDLMKAFGDDGDRIADLVSKIEAADRAYYNTGVAAMSDAAYDALKDELRDLDPDNPALKSVGAPTMDSPWEDKKHEVPMASLDKVNTIDEFLKWAVDKNLKTQRFCVQDKMDGLSVSIKYVNGSLKSAVTRGDGEAGEEITRNVLKMKGVPKQLKTGFTGCLQGEIMMRHDVWKRYFTEMANPRNAASGVSRRLSGEGVEHLTVFFYNAIPQGLTKPFATEMEKMLYLVNKLEVWTPHFYECDVIGVAKVYQDYEDQLRAKLPYDIDGLVIKTDDLEFQAALGRSGDRLTGNPRGQIALKFAHEMRESTIERITWEVGKTGRVTPLAHIKTVRIGGVNVSRASLHNIANVVKLGVSAGATVLVSRRNDVIPYVEEVLKKSAEPMVVPSNCPVCGTALVREGEYLQDLNEDCPARIVGNLEKWINNLDIEDFGPKLLVALYQKGLVKDVADLYKLKVKDIAGLERMGERSAKKVLDNLHAKKEIPVDIFLGSLNIQGCDRKKFRRLVEEGYDSFDKLMKLKIPEMAQVKGLGAKTATDIYTGLRKKEDLIRKVRKHVTILEVKTVTGPLSGSSFCFTGTMQMPRPDLAKLATDKGADVKGGVTKGLTYLVLADPTSTSTKAQKARQLGTKTISEEEFLKLVGAA